MKTHEYQSKAIRPLIYTLLLEEQPNRPLMQEVYNNTITQKIDHANFFMMRINFADKTLKHSNYNIFHKTLYLYNIAHME